ncbi:MAG: hypothetical protein HON65_14880, partial [Rhodospirillales bacterium]|nr:hypothetical protein [Rhodospirillales bacterium]
MSADPISTVLDFDKLRDIADQEAARLNFMIPKSLELGKRAHKSQPNGVAMPWMTGLYEHAPIYVTSGD